MSDIIIDNVSGPYWSGPDHRDAMFFKIQLSESEFKNVKSAAQRQDLALRILAAMENSLVDLHNHVNELRANRGMPAHDFDFPTPDMVE